MQITPVVPMYIGTAESCGSSSYCFRVLHTFFVWKVFFFISPPSWFLRELY